MTTRKGNSSLSDKVWIPCTDVRFEKNVTTNINLGHIVKIESNCLVFWKLLGNIDTIYSCKTIDFIPVWLAYINEMRSQTSD